MGRSQYAILGMGLAAMLVLSVLMKYFLNAAGDQKRSPVEKELAATYGDHLDSPSELRLVDGDGGPQAVLTIHPLLEAGSERLAREMGNLIWRRIGTTQRLASVVVLSRPWASRNETRVDVPCPFVSGPRGPQGGASPPRSGTAPAPRQATPKPTASPAQPVSADPAKPPRSG